MRFCFVSWFTVFSLLFSVPTFAQTVQLPTVRAFGIQTTVSVPDHGAAVLGGNTRSLLSRGRSSYTTSNGYVTAQVIDLEETDALVLAEARRRRAKRNLAMDKSTAIRSKQAASRAAYLSRYVGRARSIDNKNAESSAVSQIRNGKIVRSYSALMELGRKAMSEGRYRDAKQYYLEAGTKAR